MLSLIFLIGTPSNRTSRVRADRVAGWRVTMNYSVVIQAVIQFVTQAVPADASSGRGHQDRLSTRTDWRPRGLGRGKPTCA